MPQSETYLTQMLQDPTGGLPTMAPVPQTQPGVGLNPQKAFEALDTLVAARTEAEKAKQKAMEANTTVTNTLLADQERIDKENLEAYDNLMRIDSLGGDNPVTKILGIFDSRYNRSRQQSTLLKNQINSAASQRRAETQININNTTPALLASQAEQAALNFGLYKDTLDIA